jgi:hypothetical protein
MSPVAMTVVLLLTGSGRKRLVILNPEEERKGKK